MLYKAAAVGAGAGLRTQPHLQRRERAGDAHPCLRYNDCDGCKVCQSEPPPIDPAPAQQVARDDERQAADDEHDDREVQGQHPVGEPLVSQHVGKRSPIREKPFSRSAKPRPLAATFH